MRGKRPPQAARGAKNRQSDIAGPRFAESVCNRPPGAVRTCARMTEPTTFTRGLSIALMAFLDAVLPALVAVGMLYGLCAFYGIEFKGFFVVLAILSGMLSRLLL